MAATSEAHKQLALHWIPTKLEYSTALIRPDLPYLQQVTIIFGHNSSISLSSISRENLFITVYLKFNHKSLVRKSRDWPQLTRKSSKWLFQRLAVIKSPIIWQRRQMWERSKKLSLPQCLLEKKCRQQLLRWANHPYRPIYLKSLVISLCSKTSKKCLKANRTKSLQQSQAFKNLNRNPQMGVMRMSTLTLKIWKLKFNQNKHRATLHYRPNTKLKTFKRTLTYVLKMAKMTMRKMRVYLFPNFSHNKTFFHRTIWRLHWLLAMVRQKI